MNDTKKHGSECSSHQARTTRTDEQAKATPFTQWPWLAQFALALSIIVVVLVLLVGLPTVSLLVAEKTSAGLLGNSLSGTMSFWGALFAAFISLVVVFIAAAFAFTAFKVEGNAAQEARKVARMVAKEECKDTIRDAAYKYIEEEVETDGEKEKQPRGEKIVREAADDYAKNYVDDKGPEITRVAAGDYISKDGERITKEVADMQAKNYVDNNGQWITEEAATIFVKQKGDEIVREVAAVRAKNYIDHNGAGITRGVADDYIREAIGEGEPPRGDKITRQTADAYVHYNGAGITREAADDYVRSAVDDYASEDLEGEDMTMIEKVTRETVKKVSADEVARLVDEHLASLGLTDMLRLRFRRRARRNETDSSGDGQR